MVDLNSAKRIEPDARPSEQLVVDAGLELAIAIYDTLLVDCGRDFADYVRQSFEARLLRRRKQGGDEAEAADAVAKTFLDFDWYRAVITDPL